MRILLRSEELGRQAGADVLRASSGRAGVAAVKKNTFVRRTGSAGCATACSETPSAFGRKFEDPKCFYPDFRDSRDLFIHGLIDGPGGTCASMPVMYVAVGRRLRSPPKLVQTRGHLFARWVDQNGKCFGFQETFNVEGAGEGIASHDDEHYKTGPEPWTEIDEAEGRHLKSMAPLEELASFVAARGDCFTDNGRLGEAVQAYMWASVIAPKDKRYQQILAHASEVPGTARARDGALDGNEPAKSRTRTANASGTDAQRTIVLWNRSWAAGDSG